MKIKLLLCFLCGLSLTVSTYAANFYASPTGKGSGNSLSDPGSFATGRSKLSSVDTLYLLSGQYDIDSKVSINASGTSSKYKVIAAYPGETPVFDFRAQPYGKEITGSDNTGISISSGVKYLHIKGLTIRYAGKVGLLNQGSNCLIENCVVYGCGDSGIQMKNGGNNVIQNCDSYNNFDYKTLSGDKADYGGNADGFADKQHSGAPNTYIGCRSWNNSDDGWDFYQRVGGTSILIDCICYNIGPGTFDMSSHPRAVEGGADVNWFNEFKGAGKQVVDRHNVTRTVTIDKYINLGNGNGFKLGGDYTNHNVKLSRCLAVGNTVRGFDQNNNAGEMTLYNCSAYNNGYNYGFYKVTNSSLIIKNCVSLSSKNKDDFSTPKLETSHNSWNTSGVTCTVADFRSLDTNLILASRNADGSLPVNDFMRLAEGSDLIDAGIDVTLPYSGSAPDLGCYETGDVDKYPGEVISPSNKDQSIQLGDAVTDIVFTWGGGATGLEVTGLPAGLNADNINQAAKTVTISGIPTVSGTYTYTVSTVGGTDIPDVATGEITILAIISPSNKDQTIPLGGTIDNIVFQWKGDATSLSVTGLPEGIQSTVDTGAKTLIIYGTATAASATYTYTVSTVGGTNSDTATGEISILPVFIPSQSKYYNIYSYGKSNGGATTAKTSDAKQFMTASGSSLLLVEGLSDDAEQNGEDPTRALHEAQWQIAMDGGNTGYYTIKNRSTGAYLQVSANLSSSAVNVVLEFKKDDNSKPGYAIYNAAKDKCAQINNTSITAFNGYADRTRMRWVMEEVSGDINPVEENTAQGISVYPNPTADFVYFDVQAHVKVYTLQGVLLQEFTGVQIDMSAYPEGFYLLQVNGQLIKVMKK